MIKKQILIVLVILINILFSCNSKKQNIAYTLVIKDTISVILPENNFINIKNFDYFQENDSDYILLYFYSKSKLYLFNLTSKKFIKSIPIYPWFSTLHFKYINKDSIWIFGGTTYHYNHDSSLMVIDDRGKIKHIFPIEHPKIIGEKTFPIFSEEMNKYKEDVFDTCIFADVPYTNTFIKFNKINFIFYSEKKGKGSDYPYYATFNLKDKKFYWFYENYKVNTPENIPNFYKEYKIIERISDSKNLISFYYTTKCLIFDEINNKFEEKTLQPQLYNKTFTEIIDTNNFFKNDVIHLSFNSKINKFIQVINFNKEQYGNTRLFVTYDENLNYMGECVYQSENKYLPMNDPDMDNYFYFEVDSNILRIIRTEWKEIITDINTEKQKLNKIKILTEEKNKRCNLITQQQSNSKKILTYIKTFNLKDSLVVLTILNSNGCPSCNESIINFIRMNSSLLFNLKGFYLIYVNEYYSSKKLIGELKNMGIYYKMKTLIDTTTNYSKTFANDNQPKLLIIKNDEIVYQKSFLPHQIEEYFNKIIEFYKLEKK